MSTNGFLSFISDDFIGQFSHISTAGGPGNLLDGYAISRDHTAEYVEGSLQIIPMHETLEMTLLEYRNNVSDHLPLDAVFRITEDDD